MQLYKCIIVTSASALFGHRDKGQIACYINTVVQVRRAGMFLVPSKAQHQGVEETIVGE